MRLILVVLCLCYLSFAGAEEPEKKLENLCEKAVKQETDFQVTGIYGSPLESEWHPAAAYVLRKEMQRFEVLQREFQKKTAAWRLNLQKWLVVKLSFLFIICSPGQRTAGGRMPFLF